MSKKCSRCNIEKELDMFGKFNRKTKIGIIFSHKYKCKSCETETQRNRRNKEKEADPEKYHKKWADYYSKTKEENKKAKQNWLNIPENREKRNEYIRKYKADKRLNDNCYKLFENHRKKIWKSLKNKSNSSKELLGCDIENYIKWISYTMTAEMNWVNYGTYWNIDHIIPVNTFDINNQDEVKKAFNWKNTWAMKSSENFSKKTKIIPEQIIEHTNLLNKYIIENNIV